MSNSASLANGKIWIGDGAGKAQEQTLGGDASLAANGTLTLNTVPVSKGGTAATSFAADKVITTNGTGTALQATSCGLNQVISFTAGGAITCQNVSSLFAGFVNGGNSFGAAADLGTNDNFDLNFKTNGSAKMSILANGNVGIGTTSPSTTLHVKGGDMTIDHAGQQIIYFRDGSGGAVANVGFDGSVFLVGDTASGGGAVPLALYSNNAERVRIDTSGNVGVGLTNPGSKLQVSGAITNTITSFTGSFTCGTSSLDFSTSNFQRLAPSNTIAAGTCNVALSNLVAGGSYTLVVTGNAATNAVTYNFTGYTVKYLPVNGPTTAGSDTIYTFLYDGTTVYVTWGGGYQ